MKNFSLIKKYKNEYLFKRRYDEDDEEPISISIQDNCHTINDIPITLFNKIELITVCTILSIFDINNLDINHIIHEYNREQLMNLINDTITKKLKRYKN